MCSVTEVAPVCDDDADARAQAQADDKARGEVLRPRYHAQLMLLDQILHISFWPN